MLYQYDLNGDLVGVSDREGNTTRMKYEVPNRPHYLSEIIDPLDRSEIRTDYNANWQLVKVIDANGNLVQMEYDFSNSVVTVNDTLGHPTTYEYDPKGNVDREVDGITKRTYDDNNNLLSETDADGSVVSYTLYFNPFGLELTGP